jgi:DNA invertase Pin-like site-specific DNA recombinase
MSDVRRHLFRKLFYGQSDRWVRERQTAVRSAGQNWPIPKTPLNFASQISLSVEFFPSLFLCAQGREITMKRVALYLRVSTAKQDTDNQRRELEAVAERSGWEIVRIYEDAGISGAKGREQRPGLDTMMRAVNAKRFDMVMAWSVDRLGRSLTDLLGILQALQDKGIDLFLLDTSTTAGKAMFQMLGVFAEFERGIIRERVNAGLARARQNGTKLGRRRVKPSVEATIRELRAKGDGILKIARTLGVGTSVVQRVVLETA